MKVAWRSRQVSEKGLKHAAAWAWAVIAALPGGCPTQPETVVGIRNTNDPTNRGATYVGSAACMSCHESQGSNHVLHGHAAALLAVRDGQPAFPAGFSQQAVIEPPENTGWREIAYVLGGYLKGANFVDLEGFLITSGPPGGSSNAQWNGGFAANGTKAGAGPVTTVVGDSNAFDYSCFKCHTTGARPQRGVNPEFQDNRAGMAGTFEESGVQCEACHGPGSNHFRIVGGAVQVDRSAILTDSDGVYTCFKCHGDPDAQGGRIAARAGFIEHYAQAAELRASGGHAGFSCGTCHDTHASTTYDRSKGIRNECRACHTTETMAAHEGKVLRLGEYTEVLTCESCHMPFATRTATSAPASLVGEAARVGDTRTHIFRIRRASEDYRSFFTEDGSEVRRDASGQAEVTVDFACLRCHNGNGAFELDVDFAGQIAQRIHELP